MKTVDTVVVWNGWCFCLSMRTCSMINDFLCWHSSSIASYRKYVSRDKEQPCLDGYDGEYLIRVLWWGVFTIETTTLVAEVFIYILFSKLKNITKSLCEQWFIGDIPTCKINQWLQLCCLQWRNPDGWVRYPARLLIKGSRHAPVEGEFQCSNHLLHASTMRAAIKYITRWLHK